jgi:hypothetical protein
MGVREKIETREKRRDGTGWLGGLLGRAVRARGRCCRSLAGPGQPGRSGTESFFLLFFSYLTILVLGL